MLPRMMPHEPGFADHDHGLTGPIVVLDRNENIWAVWIEPPPTRESRRATFTDKNSAWAEALRLCAENRCGLRDEACGMTGSRSAIE